MADFPLTQTAAEIQVILNNAETLGSETIAIGNLAGVTSQGQDAVAIGDKAGNDSQGVDSVAVGSSSGLTAQGTLSVSVGGDSGKFNQGVRSVAVGKSAGTLNQGDLAVAIGNLAGDDNQPDNSIVISADNVSTTPSAVGEILIHTTTTDVLSDATKLTHNGKIIAGTAMKVGTLASPPTGMAIGEQWLDTTGSAVHPLLRRSTVST